MIIWLFYVKQRDREPKLWKRKYFKNLSYRTDFIRQRNCYPSQLIILCALYAQLFPHDPFVVIKKNQPWPTDPTKYLAKPTKNQATQVCFPFQKQFQNDGQVQQLLAVSQKYVGKLRYRSVWSVRVWAWLGMTVEARISMRYAWQTACHAMLTHLRVRYIQSNIKHRVKHYLVGRVVCLVIVNKSSLVNTVIQ